MLDIACGHGRIANRIASKGATVLGIDTNPDYLRSARIDAAARGVATRFELRDMRDLQFRREFDAAISWFTSFGYHSDRVLKGILNSSRKALKPGGRLLVDTINPAFLTANFEPESISEQGRARQVLRRRMDSKTKRLYESRVVTANGVSSRAQYFVRLLTVPEMTAWLRAAGFHDISILGAWGRKFDDSSPRIIAVAK